MKTGIPVIQAYSEARMDVEVCEWVRSLCRVSLKGMAHIPLRLARAATPHLCPQKPRWQLTWAWVGLNWTCSRPPKDQSGQPGKVVPEGLGLPDSGSSRCGCNNFDSERSWADNQSRMDEGKCIPILCLSDQTPCSCGCLATGVCLASRLVHASFTSLGWHLEEWARSAAC